MEAVFYANAARAFSRASGNDAHGGSLAANPVGAVTFICAGVYLAITASQAALLAMAVTFLFRSITIAFNWRTAPVSSGAIFTHGDDPPAGGKN